MIYRRKGAAPRICTGTVHALDVMPLLVGLVRLLKESGCPASIRTMTTWFRARQATVTSRGKNWSQRPVTLRHPPLYKSGEITCPSTLAENGGSRRACSSSHESGTICFRNSPGALVRFGFLLESRGSPRCCPVLCGLRVRCIAAMLATRKRKSVGMLHNLVKGPSGFQPAAARSSALTSMVAPAGLAPAPDGL